MTRREKSKLLNELRSIYPPSGDAIGNPTGLVIGSRSSVVLKFVWEMQWKNGPVSTVTHSEILFGIYNAQAIMCRLSIQIKGTCL